MDNEPYLVLTADEKGDVLDQEVTAKWIVANGILKSSKKLPVKIGDYIRVQDANDFQVVIVRIR